MFPKLSKRLNNTDTPSVTKCYPAQTNKQVLKVTRKKSKGLFLYLAFFEKKLAIKDMMCDTSVPMTLQIELSNEQEQTQLFFLSNGKKALSGSTLYANSFTSFFSNFFNLILISQKSVKLQSVFQNFFSYHCHTLAKI